MKKKLNVKFLSYSLVPCNVAKSKFSIQVWFGFVRFLTRYISVMRVSTKHKSRKGPNSFQIMNACANAVRIRPFPEKRPFKSI